MKGLLIKLFVLCILVLGNFSNKATASGLGGGSVFEVFDKSGTLSLSFLIPDHYFNTNGTLQIPLNIRIIDNKKSLTHSSAIYEPVLFLSELDLNPGEYFIWIAIGEFNLKTTINL